MKQSFTLTLFKQVALTCATLAALTGVPVQAQTPGTDLSVAATLITSNSIT
jgi:hypothetical protein